MDHSGGLIQRAFSLEYRLSSAAPYPAKNAFPAALLDALAGYRYLVHDIGFDPRNIVIEGESAGGHLGVNLVMYLVRLQNEELPLPGGLLLLSPTMDWACTHDGTPSSSMTRNRAFDYVHRILACGYSGRALRGALPEAELAFNPYLSPSSLALATTRGFFRDFPPTCIIAGEDEVTLDPMRTLRDRIVADNGMQRVLYCEYADAVHNWIPLLSFEDQGLATLRAIKTWIESLYSAVDGGGVWGDLRVVSTPVKHDDV
ncbi:alpha/beta-hydrolase [Exidia glandulosa HHB12029]|uniref:Alpha/beta-hydrolase n=1 Tax=Exidia glandulosa HHB12029 TaxID=1314781 RepID=A0A165DZ33_EXIGL|nr:alpha/beta-hydrolase [Exidia glandulosa HHB12029]